MFYQIFLKDFKFILIREPILALTSRYIDLKGVKDMGYQNVFKRYELKYILTQEEKESLLQAMEKHMISDPFGKNTICNIYFDTPDKLLVRRSLEKPVYREKLRVRSYGVANPDSKVFIEIKKKYKGIVYKRRINLKEKVARSYLIEGKPLKKHNQISAEIDYLMNFYKNIEPSIFLSYDREAFYSKEDRDFRMTFDEKILARDYDISLNAGVYGEFVLPKDKVILEVKTVFGVPIWLRNFLNENHLYKTSFSKYGNTYLNMLLPKRLENTQL
ncbi:polyphosphate polymerase domain-containing protein [Jeotgalibaca sp. MA1X17-3]|uniref:polyphosphate polymerase domain-containing protein n=1 Tax=Jeotgalibaca sp. MA1X17-3 TaxID=2908211 RepID=UPI001F1A5C0D|nr:polyphosphate polymerase domain-containing protein [Jeotgalibaca sp. MA1X17-3]UJF16259.1 polyphosphate polymerase domain-containing protein [Jeotgalibaca sp. MA1X17-3]